MVHSVGYYVASAKTTLFVEERIQRTLSYTLFFSFSFLLLEVPGSILALYYFCPIWLSTSQYILFNLIIFLEVNFE